MSRRAVIFDLDDTLIVEEAFAMESLRAAIATFPGVDPVASQADALEAVRSVWRTGPDYPLAVALGLASWEGLWSTFEGNDPCMAGLHAWAPTYRVAAWDAVAAHFDADDPALATTAAAVFEGAQRAGHPNIAGMEEALDGVRSRHPVGLLTNGSSDLQRLKLDQAGLAGAFGTVVVSGEVGVGKPQPAVFGLALERLGADAGASVMVGDSWERDVEGGLAAGMTAVWIAAGRTPPAEDPRVTVVDSVRDLADALD